jgi:hypothetical protein
MSIRRSTTSGRVERLGQDRDAERYKAQLVKVRAAFVAHLELRSICKSLLKNKNAKPNKRP